MSRIFGELIVNGLFRKARVLLTTSGVSIGAALLNASAADYTPKNFSHGEVLASTQSGVPIIDPEHRYSDSPPEKTATFVRTVQQRFEIGVMKYSYYEIKAEFSHMSPTGECLLTYHDIPSLQEAIDSKASARLTSQAVRAIDALRAQAAIFRNNPNSIVDGEWRRGIPEKEDCPVSLNDYRDTMPNHYTISSAKKIHGFHLI